MLPQGASQLSDFGSIRYVTTRQEQQRQGRKIRPRGEKGFKEREENLVPPVPLASILKIEIDPVTLKMTTPEEIRSLIEMAEAQGIPVVIKPLFLQQSVQEFRPLQ